MAVVTGIGSGIGKGCALMFAQHGAVVLGCDIDAKSAQSSVSEFGAQGLTVDSVHPIDLSSVADATHVMSVAVERFGGIDILVNAAAFGAFAWIQEMDYREHWKKTLVGELDVVFVACQAVWPHMIQRGGGSIVNFASANAHVALPGSPALAHCAGKGGVLAMTRQLAMEGAPHGIRANTISPGLIVTSATKQALDGVPGLHESVMQKLMIKRLGQPTDIGWCATFLASNESSWITAADFRVDGGATSW